MNILVLCLLTLSFENFRITSSFKQFQRHPMTVFWKYLFRKANNAYNFLLLEDGYKFLDERSIHVQFSKQYLINSLQFSEVYFLIFFHPGYTICLEKGNLKFSDLKCDGERNQKNSHFHKTFNSPRMTEEMKIL